jgi:hypothetical protein
VVALAKIEIQFRRVDHGLPARMLARDAPLKSQAKDHKTSA